MRKKPLQQLRIIGGTLRSRLITFPSHSEIRPTPNRVRETLFNWLSPVIEGAYCLDLFSGSGALGLEALSRGARHVVMVDKSPIIIEHLRTTCQKLNVANVTLCQAKAPEGVILPHSKFDIIFLDPPFHQGLIKPSIEWLEKNQFLTPQSYIYIEMARFNEDELPLPAHWQCLKSGETRQISYYLLKPVEPN